MPSMPAIVRNLVVLTCSMSEYDAVPGYDTTRFPPEMILVVSGSPPIGTAPCYGKVLLSLTNLVGTATWSLAASSSGPSGVGSVHIDTYGSDTSQRLLVWDGFTFSDLDAYETEIAKTYTVDITTSSGQSVSINVTFGWNPLYA